MANGNYTMTDLDYSILRFCDTPKSSREIAEEFNANHRTVQFKVGQLKALGLLAKSKKQPEDDQHHKYRYVRTSVAIPTELNVKKEYKPLGICVMGVWL